MKTSMALRLCAVWLALGAVAWGESPEFKQRFRERKPALDALKAQGLVGENNRGYVAFVGAARRSEDLVAAENADRRTLYGQIASETQTSADLVGARRAAQLTAQARSGTFIQEAGGQWVKKR